MFTESRRTRAALALTGTAATAIAAIAVGAAATATAAASPSKPAASSSMSVTAFYKAPNMKALNALADAKDLSHAQRVAALKPLLPSAATDKAVTAQLVKDGFTVKNETAWSITASAPSSIVAKIFGTRLNLHTLASPPTTAAEAAADIREASGPLPKVPGLLSHYVSHVFPTTGGPSIWHHMAETSLTGADYRNAYTSPAASSAVYDGSDPNGHLTVATLQLSNWHSSDLTGYATAAGLPDPVKSGQFKSINVDGGTTDTSGSAEVDIDEESILDTDPNADEQMYIAPNTDAGFDDVYANVLDDVMGNSKATAANPTIDAMSSSWGECEGLTGATSIKTLEPILASLDAAGVTMFSAAGDDGIYDCGTATIPGVPTTVTGVLGSLPVAVPGTSADVDYPGSAPEMVSVGGSNLQYGGTSTTSTANTGSNWLETAWTCSNVVGCESAAGTGGSGGGQSGSNSAYGGTDAFAGFPAPAYQKSYVTTAPFAGQTNRLVPDITADGDPETGFSIYSPGNCSPDDTCVYGGTSLASPVSAALLTDTLAHYGLTGGVGDIHNALYLASSDDYASTFRDVTSGSNGSANQEGTDPSVDAATGFDTVSGLGAPLWPALAPFLIKGQPAVADAIKLTTPESRTASRTVKAAWIVAQSRSSGPIQSADVRITQLGSSTPLVNLKDTTAIGTTSFTGVPGADYVMAVRGYDVFGNTKVKYQSMVVPIDDHYFNFHKTGWNHENAPADFASTLATNNTKHGLATITATGKTFGLEITTGPTAGRLVVYVGGKRVKVIDEYSKKITHSIHQFYSLQSRGSVAFTFKSQGIKDKKSHGHVVDIDALYVTY